MNPTRVPLSILVKITQIGESLPYGEVTVDLVEETFQNSAGVSPLEVLILNYQDTLVDWLIGAG